MDERESLYFDTISLAESEAAAAAAAHRKSISQSRNTIYHSAVDLAGDEGRSSLRLGGATSAEHAALAWQPGYRQSTALEHLNGGGGGDHTDAAIAAQMIALQNGRNHLPTGIGVAGGDGGGHGGGDDEVSRRLLRSSSNISNKDKKLPITYSQWKSRVNNDSNITNQFKFKIKLKFRYQNQIRFTTLVEESLRFCTAAHTHRLSISSSLLPCCCCCSISPHFSATFTFTPLPELSSKLPHSNFCGQWCSGRFYDESF